MAMRGLIADYCGVVSSDPHQWAKLFTEARTHGLATAILSNDSGGPGADEIRSWQWQGYVDAVVLSGEVGYSKPRPEVYHAAARAIGVAPEDCVFTDDYIGNVHGAANVGMKSLLYLGFDHTAPKIGEYLGIDLQHI